MRMILMLIHSAILWRVLSMQSYAAFECPFSTAVVFEAYTNIVATDDQVIYLKRTLYTL